MEELIELLTQIQELAGVGIDALNQAAEGGGAGPEGPTQPEGEAPPEGGPPPEEEPAQ